MAQSVTRARPVLQALVRGVPDDQALVVAVERGGFPLAQRVLEVPDDLPSALVIGRHTRCGLPVPSDRRLSLRHLLAILRPGSGSLRFQIYDLGGFAGLVLADGQQAEGVSFRDQGLLLAGQTLLFVLPGGERGLTLLEGSVEDMFSRLTGSGPGGAIDAWVGPEGNLDYVDAPREYGGYRGLDIQVRNEPRGVLTLRATRPSRGKWQPRRLDLDTRSLQRGVLIGRYSDRCALAGQGRNLSRVHALVADEGPDSLLVFDLASTNGVRPVTESEGPGLPVVRLTAESPVMLGHFELSWSPGHRPNLH